MSRRTYIQAIRTVAVAVLVSLFMIGTAQTDEDLLNPPDGEWPTHNRTLEGHRFSPLDQVNRDNVSDLRLTWSRDLGFEGGIQMSPVVWNGVMYIAGVGGVAQALDATTGDLIWEYQGEMHPETRGHGSDRMRGGVVVYDGNVYYNRGDGVMVALDAETGEEVWSTRLTNMDLAEGFSAGPIFADGKIITGNTGADAGGAPGKVFAVDAQDGELLWTFNIIPEPGDPAYDTWAPAPPSWEEGVGGGVTWNPGAYDPVTNTVIYGTGQPIPWERFTGSRLDDGPASADLYTASYVALDVDTGELKWHFQPIPGDEWDGDQQTTPTFIDAEIDGTERRVALLPLTAGYIVLADAETGEFLQSHAFNPEYTVLMGFEDDGTPIINEEARMSESGETMLLCPMRWVNFQQATYNPETGVYFRPNVLDCRDYTQYGIPDEWEAGQRPLDFEFNVHYDRFERYGGISAINPISGEVLWDYGHGYDQRGGVVGTAGDLVFGAFEDRIFRALDAETGEVVWQQVLNAMMRSNPITYSVDGVQYVAVLTGNASAASARADLPPTVPGPATAFVFSLPQD